MTPHKGSFFAAIYVRQRGASNASDKELAASLPHLENASLYQVIDTS
jgi:hypothetical protein